MRYAPLISVLALGLAVGGCSGEEASAVGAPTPGTTRADSAEAITTLSVGGASARCVYPVDPGHLRANPLAFEATVVSKGREWVTLEVTTTFKGRIGETVRLRSREGNPEALLGGGDFQDGRSYLITADQGDVSDCQSGVADNEDLRKSYAEAFSAR